MPENPQVNDPQRVEEVLIAAVVPRGPPTPVWTMTAAGLPPPPAPATQPDEKAALKLCPVPLESRNTFPVSPERIQE